MANLEDKTVEYPHRKPKKVIPTKLATMLLTIKGKQIQLEKRPPSGIWGGLWSLPELDDTHQLKQQNENKQRSTIANFKHTFSHYHLQVTVIKGLKSHQTNNNVQDNKALAWHNIKQLTELALPTPIKKFLYQHFEL